MKPWGNLLLEKTRTRLPGGEVLVAVFMYLKQLNQRMKQDDCRGLAAEMAYRLILALIPALIFLFSLFGIIGRQQELLPLILKTIEDLAPPHAVRLLQQTLLGVFRSSSGPLTLIGFGVAFWAATGGASVLIKGLQRAYDIPQGKQPFWYAPLMSVLVVSALGLMIFLTLNLVVLGDLLLLWAQRTLQVEWNTLLLFNGLRWFVMMTGSTLLTAFIYALILRPKSKKMHWHVSLPGAFTSVFLWILISQLFGMYVTKMGQFNPVYGTLGAVVILITWLYLSSLAMFVGGEIVALQTSAHAGPPEAGAS